jgi:hypothetical protein
MVRACPKPPRNPTIFVNIASERDPECVATVADLLANARHPDAVTVGLVLEAGRKTTPMCIRKTF